MKPVVSVQRAGIRERSTGIRHLAPGQSTRFATCLCGRCEYDLVIPVVRRIAAAGRVIACRDHWRIENAGQVPFTVTDLEYSQSLLTVPGGRRWTVMPFELALVSADQVPLVTVFGPEPEAAVPPVVACPEVAAGDRAGALDPHTTYFAVLVALCEPRLRHPGGSALPTSAEIAQRLSRRGIMITRRAVDWHIEYLTGKLGLRPPRGPDAAKRSWRKEAVAAAALQRLLVRPEHLPRRRQRSTAVGWPPYRSPAGAQAGTVQG